MSKVIRCLTTDATVMAMAMDATDMVAEAESKKAELLRDAETSAKTRMGELRQEIANEEARLAAARGSTADCWQSNHEGAIVDRIQAALGTADGIVINPAAYTHTSVAILDALKAVNLPAVEVHISDVSQREDFRQVSYAGMACVQTYMGLGLEGYRKAILFLKDYLQHR